MPGYTLPDGVTLKNKLGAQTYQALVRLEGGYVSGRIAEIRSGAGPSGNFDAKHLKAFHRHLFQDVYEWAGRTRDERVALSDGAMASEPNLRKADGKPFIAATRIAPALRTIAVRLKDADYLRGLSRNDFAKRAADVMAEINGVHPFREGNGRTQRLFMQELARGAGHSLDFRVVSRERMVQASIAANDKSDPSMMRRLFDEISDQARVAILRTAIAALERQDFTWNDRYLATLEPDHEVALIFAGMAGDQFMARTDTQILFGRTIDLPEPPPERGQKFVMSAGTSYGAVPAIAHTPQSR